MSKGRNGVLILLGLVVLGVLAWVTLKPAPSPAATLTNRILFIAILAAGAALVVRARRAGSSLPVATVASAAGLFFLAVAVLFVGHLGGVLSLLLRSTSTPYDFRFFSLLLLGVVGLAPAVQGLRAWPGLARSANSCWRRSLRACLLLLAINVPLIPLQDFAVAFSIAGTGVLASLWLAQVHFEAQ